MDSSFIIIIVVLIFLKILFWTFWTYARVQRYNRCRAQQGFIIVTPQPVPVHTQHDQSSILQNEYLPATDYLPQPPAYNEAMATSESTNDKPPSYEQVVQN